MRRRAIAGGLILLGVSVALLPVLLGREEAHPPDPPPAPAAFDPYDSVRTDLLDYAWPTDASRALTSTFGEYRRTHFHAGIDISTNDRTGYRVFASRDGYVARITVNADGYGKILYLRHRDGYTTTYAHLEKFAPPIEARTRRQQRLRESYPVRIDCAPSDFPVRKGDLIAYTGETGTGTPHLHFEIRDENMNAVNPLLCPDFAVEDRIAPVIRKVALVPLLPGSAPDAGIRLLQPSSGKAAGKLPETVLEGPFGLAVQARDKSDGSRYSHGIYRYELRVNGRTTLEYKIDRVPFHESQQIALYYHRALLRSRRGRFEKLYVDAPNSIPFLRHLTTGSGLVNTGTVGEGVFRYTIIAADFNGNTASVDGTASVRLPPRFTAEIGSGILTIRPLDPASVARVLIEGEREPGAGWRALDAMAVPGGASGEIRLKIPEDSPPLVSVRLESSQGAQSPRHYFRTRPGGPQQATITLGQNVMEDHLDVGLELSEIPDEPPVVWLTGEGTRHPIPLRSLSPKRYTGTASVLETGRGARRLTARARFNGRESLAEARIELFPLTPGRRGRYRFDDGHLEVLFDTLSVYAPLFLTVDRSTEGDRVVYALGPRGAVLREGVIVRLRRARDRADSTERIYFSTGGSWRLQGGQMFHPDGAASVRLGRFLGDVALLPDTEPPEVSSLRVRASARPVITFRYADNRSGVDSHALKTYIDGEFVIPEIDGEHRRVVIAPAGPLRRGSHRLTIHIKDQLGNARVTERSFSVR